jgi:hypothetical protein
MPCAQKQNKKKANERLIRRKARERDLLIHPSECQTENDDERNLPDDEVKREARRHIGSVWA